MTILKKGTCESVAISTISSTVYVCNSCGYTTMSRDQKECPQCHSKLSKISSNEEKDSKDASDVV